MKHNQVGTTLGDLVDPESPICYGILKPGRHHPGGVPVVAVRDIVRGQVQTASLLRAAPDIESKYRRSRLKSGDILLSIRGTTGKVALVPHMLDGANVTRDTARIRISCPQRREYVFHVLQSDLVQRQIESLRIGQAVKGINIRDVKELTFLVPESEDELAILTQVFRTWAEAIEQTERLLEQKAKAKLGLMQQLLTGKKRLTGFQSAWHERRMGDLFEERNETRHGHLPLLSITREEGVISRDDVERKDTSSEDKSRYLRICPGDIGYNTMRMWQGVSALASLEGIVSPAYTICKPRDGVDPEFMAYLFKLPRTIDLFYRFSQGLTSDTWSLKFRHFREINLPIPVFEEQRAISSVLKTCDEEIKLLDNELEAVKRQKKGLMQKLLTGKWRVRSADEEG